MYLARRTFPKGVVALALTLSVLVGSLLGVSKQVSAHGSCGNRVVVVKDSQVTTWNGTDYWYGSSSYISQTRIDNMMREGIKSLTGKSTEAAAWQKIIPTYSPGTKIAIKINENNAGSGGNVIDPLPQVINATINGLKARGVAESDIYVMEPSSTMDARLGDPIRAMYPNVLIWDNNGGRYGHRITWGSAEPTLTIHHTSPHLSDSHLPDQLGDCTYVIHMPILKAHGAAGVTFTYKNLFGMFSRPTIGKFHAFLPIGGIYFSDAQDPCVDFYWNTHIKDKTCLVIGDAIYGNRIDNTGVPTKWNVFGNDWPKRIFLATDLVAIDCVMYDFLNWENARSADSERYMQLAANANQGTREHWNNSTEKKYSVIDFFQLDVENPPPDPPKNLRIIQ